MASLREVAKHAGVSLATASRVASGATGVSDGTRERVERAMRDLLYVRPRPHQAVGAIGLILPELENPVFPALAQAMERRATALGFTSFFCNTFGSADAEAEFVHVLLERRVQGFVFVSSRLADTEADHEQYERMLAEGARIVFVNGALGGVDAPLVGVDELEAGRLATQHLLDLGHERVGFVGGPAHFVPTRQKAAGREAALRDAGLDGDGLVAHAPFGVEGGARALRSLLALDDAPTGVICSSDLMAIGALREALAAGLRVPEDLSIVGFDGIDAVSWTSPPLTTVEQPIQAIAETAVETVCRLLEEPEAPLPDSMFRPRLREGGSTAPPR
jgi:DNA-binding LacI/PurR family transcriptional regulator